MVRARRRSPAAWLMAAGLFLALCSSDWASAAVTSKDLVELTDIDGLSISPDGRFAVFRTERGDVGRNTYVLRWYSVDLGTGAVRDIGSGGDPIYLDPGLLQDEKALWARDGRTIIVRRLIDGAVGLWRADVDGHGMTPLVTGDADVVDYSMTSDRTGVLYTIGATRDEIRQAEQREYDSGILVDAHVDLMQNMFRGASINGRMSTQRLVGYWWVKDGLLWRTPRQQRRIDLTSGSDTAVGGPRPVPPFTLPKWPPPLSSADAKGDLAIAAQAEDGTRSLTLTYADGHKIRCVASVCGSSRVSSLVWRPGSGDLLVTFIDRELRQSLYLWTTAKNALRKVAVADGLLNGGRKDPVPCAVSANTAICVASSAASPPRLEKVDLESGARKVLFDPNALLRSTYQPRVRYLHWSIGGGKEATAVLMEPAVAPPAPAALYVNYYTCEGFLRGGTGDEWPITELLGAGYRIACINEVPFTGPQNDFQLYNYGLAAVRTLVERLVSDHLVDPSKVAMGGLSFGSEIAFWVAMHSNVLAALSVTSPQPEPASYWSDSMPGSDIPATMRRVWGYGAPEETPKRWLLMSPALNVERIRIPVLFQMPEMEARRVPELYARLSNQGTPTELYAFPDEMHLKLQPRHRLAVYQRNLDWFRYWLEGYKDPDPSKVDEYRRWDDLRTRWKNSTAATATTAATVPAPQFH